MLVIKNSLISDDIRLVRFTCDLKACHGACCIEGDAGAPLEEEEITILENLLEKIKPFMSEEGQRTVEKVGVFDYDSTGAYVTPLINGRECVFTIFNEDHIASCAIESAYDAKNIDFQKPLSCHLYPVRLSNVDGNEVVNYHRWHICEKALTNGKKHDVYLYEFLKIPLIRKFGLSWYEELRKMIEE